MALFVRMRTLSFSVAVLAMIIGVADAQDRWQNAPGQFDYYVLSLSWSPSFCETATSNARRQQCGARPFSFVVHGLWPQYERGFPESCLEPISKSFEEDDEAGKLDKAEEIVGVVLPANEDPALPLNPGEEALNEPASHVAA